MAEGTDGLVGGTEREGRGSTKARGGGLGHRWLVLLVTVVAGLGLPIVGASVAAASATFTVTNVSDSGPGSLRQAIMDANNGSGDAVITFAIPGTGPFKISPSTDLDAIDVPVVVDGYSEPGSSRATASLPAHIEIQIDGGGIVPEGIQVSDSSGTTTVEGLSVTNFTDCGICLDGDGQVAEGNYVGLAPDGSTEGANATGIQSLATGDVVGGTTPGARNVIDTGGDVNNAGVYSRGLFTTVEGNWIGLNAAGTVGLGEGNDIVFASATSSLVFGNVLTGDDTGNVWGVWSVESSQTVVSGNLIGTNPAGTAALGSLDKGVHLQADTDAVIGASPAGGGNVIASSATGVDVNGGLRATVSGNHIGVDATNTVALPNFDVGVFVDSGGTARLSGNTIAHSAAEGVGVGLSPSDAATATVEQNSIFDNGFLGIDLGNDGVTANDGPGDGDAGPNSLQNFPILSSVTTGASTTISGTLASTANAPFTVDFYANGDLDGSGFAEGQRWLGSQSVTTDAGGVASFTVTGLAASTAGELFTATATNAAGETSEFSVSPPVAVADSATTVENKSVTFNILANDTDVDSPSGFVRVNTVGAQTGGFALVTDDGQVDFTPTSGFTGTASFSYTAVDQTGAVSNSATVTIIVTASANAAPTLAPIPDQSAQVGSQLAFTAHGSDSDIPAQTLTYSLVGAPSGAAIDSATGVVTWTPTAAQIGSASFTVQVTDNGTPNLSATTGVNVTVTAASTTTIVTSSALTSTYGQSVTFTASVSGGDHGGSVGFLADNSPIGGCAAVALGGPNGNQASCATSTLGAGTHTVTARYSGDPASGASENTLTGQIVNKAVLTVTASNGSMTYGGTPPTITATITGFVNGEGPAVLTAQPVCIANASATTPAGVHANTTSCSGAAAANYTFSYVNGTLTVGQAVLTVTASNATMTYGGTPPTITATITGFVNGEGPAVLTAQPVCTANATATTPAGTYPNTTSCSGGAAANYSFTFVKGTLTVNKAPLTVTASNATMTYGGTPPTVAALITGFVNGEGPTVLTAQPACTANATATTPAGTYPNTTSCSGGAAANYSFTFVKGTLTVNKAPLTVTASNATMTYGGTPPTVTATITGFVNGEGPAVLTAQPVCTANANPSPNAGTYPNRTSCSGAAAANYTFGYVKGTLTVKPAPVDGHGGQQNPVLRATQPGADLYGARPRQRRHTGGGVDRCPDGHDHRRAFVATGHLSDHDQCRVVGHQWELHVDEVHQRHVDGDEGPDGDHRDRHSEVTGVRVAGHHHRHGDAEPGHQRGISERHRGVHRRRRR